MSSSVSLQCTLPSVACPIIVFDLLLPSTLHCPLRILFAHLSQENGSLSFETAPRYVLASLLFSLLFSLSFFLLILDLMSSVFILCNSCTPSLCTLTSSFLLISSSLLSLFSYFNLCSSFLLFFSSLILLFSSLCLFVFLLPSVSLDSAKWLTASADPSFPISPFSSLFLLLLLNRPCAIIFDPSQSTALAKLQTRECLCFVGLGKQSSQELVVYLTK